MTNRQSRRSWMGSVTILTLTAAWPAQSQAPATSTGHDSEPTVAAQEIVVTGLKSVNGTREAVRLDNIATVDAITSDEIDRTPDRSLPEALDRVVGVSSDRGFNGSQSRFVTLRGFDSRYNSITVDGNPVWNSSRNNRGVQMDIYPASVINQTLVYKTVTPDLDPNAIGGHIAMRTLRAFDGGTRAYLKGRLSVGLYDQDNVLGDGRASYRADGVAKFTFGTANQFGIVVGLDIESDRFYDRYNEITGYAVTSNVDVLSGSAFHGLYQKKNERRSFYGKLEARQADELYAFLSAAYFAIDEDENWYRSGPFLTPTQVAAGGNAKSGNFANATAEAYLEQYFLDRKTLSLGSGLDIRVSDLSAVELRGAYSRNRHREQVSRGERFQLSGLSGSYSVGEEDWAIAYNPSAGLGNAASWRLRTNRDSFDRYIPHNDDVHSASIDFVHNQHTTARGFGLRVGLFGRIFDRSFNERIDNFRTPNGVVITLDQVAVPGQTGPNGITPYFIDPALFWSALKSRSTLTTNDSPTSDYDVVERVGAGHVALTYATDRFKLLAGLRVEHTDVTSRTGDTQATVVALATRKKKYTEFLPNLQAQWQALPQILLRAGITRTMARPDFADFAFGRRVTLDVNGYPNIAGTNPYLDPRLSWNYDLGAEWHFGKGHVTLALFHKDLSNETFTQRRETRDTTSGVVTLTETIPLNTGSATLNGLEVDGEIRPFKDGSPWLDRLELAANYTLLKGEWNVVFTDGARRTVDGLRNQPKWLGNVRLTYGYGPVEATLAWRLRGRTFTGSFGTVSANDIWVDDYNRLDAQLNVKLVGPVMVTAEIRNLTKQSWIERRGVEQDELSVAVNPGRSYWLGIRAKY
jgi:iron complex outermembrane recepter protein